MSMGKDKGIHIPSNLFMVNKETVNAIPVAALIVVFFPVLITNFLTISLYALIIFPFFYCSTKITVTRELIITTMIMSLGMFIMVYSYNKEPVITALVSPFTHHDSAQLRSMLLTSFIGFAVFIQGYFYSFTVKRPLSLLGYVFLYQWLLVGLYFIVTYGFITGTNLELGNLTIVLLPYMYLVFEGKSKLRLFFSSIVLLYLMLISCRTAFVAATVFFVTYYLYPYLVVNKRRYKLFFLFFIAMIFFSMAMYLLSGFDFIDDLSKMYFGGKSIKSGRELLWPELLTYIADRPLLGYGIHQASDYFRSTSEILKFRSLSSHNIYLEVLLRGGILLLLFFIILFYRIWGFFYSINNKISRIAASGFLAFLFVGAGLPIGLIGNIILNTLLWFYWGVAAGNTWIKNHQI